MTRRDPNVGYDIVPRRKNTYPRTNEEFLDLPRLIADFILGQNSPVRIRPDARLFLQGSCFAENLYNELKAANRPCFYNAFTEALNSPLANLVYFKSLVQQPGHAVLAELQAAHVFVLTVGVAPCWFVKATREFTPAPDLRNMDAYVHHTPTVRETASALRAVFDLIYDINPRIDIVLTLSPVPLARSMEFESAIVADCVSKSTLRAAIHETLAEYPGKKPFYFPSFEIVRWVGAHAGNAYGDDGLPRHVSRHYVQQIVQSFLASTSEAS